MSLRPINTAPRITAKSVKITKSIKYFPTLVLSFEFDVNQTIFLIDLQEIFYIKYYKSKWPHAGAGKRIQF